MKLDQGANTQMIKIRAVLLTAVNCPAKREAENAFNSVNLECLAIEAKVLKNQEKIDSLQIGISNLKQRDS